jgi:hypothetical protein
MAGRLLSETGGTFFLVLAVIYPGEGHDSF